MEPRTDQSIDQPPKYDPEMLRKFGRRATARNNLPPEFRPAVFSQPVADALLGRYYQHALESPGDKIDERLELFEVAVEVLSGEELAAVKRRHSDQPLVQRKGLHEAFLSVAGDAARLFRDDLRGPVTHPEKAAARPVAEELSVVAGVESPRNAVVDLYQDRVITSGKAKALLLLLGEPTEIPRGTDLGPFISGAANELWRVMAFRPSRPGDRADYEQDEQLRLGKGYLNTMAKLATDSPNAELRGVERVVTTMLFETDPLGETLDQAAVRRHVESHVSYALTKMYRLSAT